MELIEADLSEFTRRSRSLAVRHGDTRLARGLELGERVLVRSGHEYRSAVVADIDFSMDDTHYRLALGSTVPVDFAEDRLIGEIDVTSPGRAAGTVTVDHVALLLHRAGMATSIPQQRQGSPRPE